MCPSTLEVNSTNSCREKLIWVQLHFNPNETPRFRFSIKYLKLKVVLQIVCLVPVPLAPKLIFYMSTSKLLFTNFKDATFSSRPSIHCCFAVMRFFENWGVVCQIKRSRIQTILRQSYYTKESKALIRMTECNTTMKWLLWNCCEIEIEIEIEIETQFVLLCDVLILCDLLHVGVNVSLFKDSEDYELTFAMTFVIQCSLLHPRGRNSFLDKINVTLTCTGNLKLSTAILLLVKVGPLVCSRELNLSGMFLVLLVPHFWPILKCNVWIL